MYEKPELTLVGEAKDLVMGWAANGDDLDGSWMDGQTELAAESIADAE